MKNSSEIFMKVGLLRHANPSSMAQLAGIGNLNRVKKGRHLFYDKEEMQTVYFLVEGMVTIYKMSSNGEKKIIFTLDSGKAINEEILNGLPSSACCETLSDCLILCFPIKAFLSVMEQDFNLTKAVMDSLSVKVRRLYRQLKNTPASIRGDKRIAAKLWKMSLDMGLSDEGEIKIPMTITYLSEMLGAKRETVSRQLKILAAEGLVTYKNGRFTIHDRDRLQEYFKRS